MCQDSLITGDSCFLFLPTHVITGDSCLLSLPTHRIPLTRIPLLTQIPARPRVGSQSVHLPPPQEPPAAGYRTHHHTVACLVHPQGAYPTHRHGNQTMHPTANNTAHKHRVHVKQ